ncbi:MAG TPA: hypothetical protein VGF13_03425 [Verrucomicrobiae bacterium]|jgi:hypothetical protein
MDEEPLDAERPHDEAWWVSELHRNEKLMDKYMAVLGDNPDWDKWKNPDDLYNKVHFNIDPPGRTEDDEDKSEENTTQADDTEKPYDVADEEFEMNEAAEDEFNEQNWEDPEVNEDYPSIAKQAREFACRVFDLEEIPGNAELLYLSAGKIGANLAGGHGLGYDEEFICGNIVKCRWALSDCEFCREMLEQLHQQTGHQPYAELATECRRITAVISERIARLRKRVWW